MWYIALGLDIPFNPRIKGIKFLQAIKTSVATNVLVQLRHAQN